MVDLKDIYRTAQLLIHQHGNSARAEAIRKHNYFLNAGDVKASSLWLHIDSAIHDLEMVSSRRLVH